MENSGTEKTKTCTANTEKKVLRESRKYYDSDSYVKSVYENLRYVEEETRYIKENSKIDEKILSAMYTF